MHKNDFQLIQDISIDSFPSKEVPDEYFWANQLIIKDNKVENSNFIFANDDSTKTQALPWIIDCNLLHHARSEDIFSSGKLLIFGHTVQKLLRKLIR